MSDYLKPDLPMAWRLDKAIAGTGTLGDLGSHHIDTARYLVGEIAGVMAIARVNVPEVAGHRVEVDDAFASIVTFENGMVGTILASRVAAGYGHFGSIEVDCIGGSLRYQVGKLNELQISRGPRPGLSHHPGHQAGTSSGRLLVGRQRARQPPPSDGSSASCTRSTTSSARRSGITRFPPSQRPSGTATASPKSSIT